MTHTRRLLPRWPGPTKPSSSSQGESVLLDVFVTLTMMVTYVAWCELRREHGLAQHAEAQQAAIDQLISAVNKREGERDALQGVLNKWTATPTGQFAVEEMRARKEIQKLALLVAWDRLRRGLDICKLVRQLQDVTRIRLADDERCLPNDEAFTRLRKMSRQVFLTHGSERGVDVATVEGLSIEVRSLAGFDKDGFRPGVDRQGLALFAKGGLFDPGVLHEDNIRYLEDKIRQDLMDERRSLEVLQQLLIAQVIKARQSDLSAGTTERDARRRLRALVAELEGPLGLLPEVTEQLLADLN